mmetsp:Transcript_30600/g.47615  ORF Transcript_30600/g.47615 Transcript_30600/m.47615 type:complete len:165 (-) Transcript_30600:530-1024(-)
MFSSSSQPTPTPRSDCDSKTSTSSRLTPSVLTGPTLPAEGHNNHPNNGERKRKNDSNEDPKPPSPTNKRRKTDPLFSPSSSNPYLKASEEIGDAQKQLKTLIARITHVESFRTTLFVQSLGVAARIDNGIDQDEALCQVGLSKFAEIHVVSVTICDGSSRPTAL